MAAICRSTIIKERTPLKSEWALRSLRNDHAVYVGMGTPLISEWLRRSAGICKICDAILSCSHTDMLVTTGGISVGEKDLLETALGDLDAEIIFHGVAIKPGMPTLLAKYGDTMILGLSGNPFAAAVPLELIGRPMLSKMTCDLALGLRRSTVTMGVPYEKASRVHRFLRGRSDGHTVWIPEQQANGQMRSMVGANCLLEIPAGTERILQGEPVSVIWM